jgi:two-component system sensor histidine kinase ChvG
VRLPRPRFPIPLKLLLVSSLLALVPWLALQYFRELERLLLQVQEQGLVSTARAVATALNDRPNVLLSGEVYSLPASAGSDLRIGNLTKPIVVDGETGDWEQPGVETRYEGGSTDTGGLFSFRCRLGRYGTGVYALFEVQDDVVVLNDPARPGIAANDHIQIATVTADDEFLRFAVDARGDGPISAWLLQPDGTRLPDNRISGVWRKTATGYLAELRLPRTLIGPRLSFAVVDVDDPETRTLVGQLETGGTAERASLGTVLVPSPEISDLVRGLGRARSRIWVLDVNRRVLAQAGSLHPPAVAVPPSLSAWDRLSERWVRPLARRLLPEPREDFQDVAPGTYRRDGPEIDAALAGHDGTRSRRTGDGRAVVLSAAQPVWVESQVRGVVLVEETTNEVLATRNREFEKLFTAIVAVSLAGAVALVLFAARLSLRIGRLRNDVERAIDRQGRVSGSVRGAAAGDEIGDLARSFAGLLERQRQHTDYLEQVGRRLSHEIRTPVGVVRSSLDNLRLQELPPDARVYIERADEGLRRLATILSRMSEATGLERVLAGTEHEAYDVVPVVRGCVEGYRLAHPGRPIELRLRDEALSVLGSPDLLAQLLDKLVDNALGFARPGTPVVVALTRHGQSATLSVSNDGPRLPEEMEGRLFESMVSIRPPGGGEPHLGLGLYIVRLIAAFHGGSAAAHDRPDGNGVIVAVSLPLHAGEATTPPA